MTGAGSRAMSRVDSPSVPDSWPKPVAFAMPSKPATAAVGRAEARELEKEPATQTS